MMDTRTHHLPSPTAPPAQETGDEEIPIATVVGVANTGDNNHHHHPYPIATAPYPHDTSTSHTTTPIPSILASSSIATNLTNELNTIYGNNNNNNNNTYDGKDKGIQYLDGSKWGTYIGSTTNDSSTHGHGSSMNIIRHGQGKIQYKDGSSYDGSWYMDKMHGYGTYRYPSGPMLVGKCFHHGSIHGYGTYYYPDGKRIDLRHYEDNEIVGEGVQFDFKTGGGSEVFLLNRGRVKGLISHNRAMNIANRFGLSIPTSSRIGLKDSLH